MDSSGALQIGLQHHQAGRLAEAEAVYRQILQREPNHPDALHLLGALAGQCGQPDAAIDLIRQAIRHRPNYPEALRNLAALLAQADRYEESIATYQKIVAISPDRADVLNDFGSVLIHENRFDEAAVVLSKAAEIQSNFGDAHKNLGSALRKKGLIDQALAASTRAVELGPRSAEAHYEHALNLSAIGRTEDALAEYRRAVQLKPDFEEAYNNMGKILAESGRLDEAIALYARAIEIKPATAKFHFNLGQIFLQGDRLEDAISAFRAAVQADPGNAETHANLAIVLAKLQRYGEALASHARAAAIAPGDAVTHEALGEILLNKLDSAAAAVQFRRATEIDPEKIDPWIRLGVALQSLGKFDEAVAAFRRAIVLRPDLAGVYQNLIRIGKNVADDAEIKRMIELLKDTNVTGEERAGTEFALGKSFDEADRFDEAFAHYAEGNEIIKQRRALAGDRHDPELFRTMIDQMIDTYTPQFFQDRRGWGDPSELPIFIVGMPRSGTTLVHQIAASHPQIHGVGERNDIKYVAKSMGGTEAKSAAQNWTRDAITTAAKEYVQRLSILDNEALRVVDKQPGNVIYLGLITLLFPRARIILCRRDPRDTCLSCFFQNFATGSLFSFDLVHCGHYQVDTYRLMDHWLRVSPLTMLEVHYEQLVAGLEKQSRRLIDFLGLPWDPACLDFHRAETAVLTSSVWQVRQPIYSSSVGRWRNYERHLGPLLQALGDRPERLRIPT